MHKKFQVPSSQVLVVFELAQQNSFRILKLKKSLIWVVLTRWALGNAHKKLLVIQWLVGHSNAVVQKEKLDRSSINIFAWFFKRKILFIKGSLIFKKMWFRIKAFLKENFLLKISRMFENGWWHFLDFGLSVYLDSHSEIKFLDFKILEYMYIYKDLFIIIVKLFKKKINLGK